MITMKKTLAESLKSYFMPARLSFKLTLPNVQPFLEGPEPEDVCIPLLPGHKPIVKKKDEVSVGSCIAVQEDPRRGDAHSAIDGVVVDVTARSICIKRQPVTNPVSITPEPVNVKDLPDDELAPTLKKLGLGRREFNNTGDHIIINGFNPEPGIHWAGGMYANYFEELKDAIGIIRRMMKPSQISIVLPEGSRYNFGSDIRHFYAKPVYPNSMSALIAKTVTKSESPKKISIFSLHSLWRYAQVVATGLPALNTVMTIQGKNYKVLAGTPIRTLLSHAGITPIDGDYVILGGYMRGRAISDLERCVASYAYGLFFVAKDEFATVHENPCVNCGACVAHCPAHLMPNTISRNAEFQLYDECKKLHVMSCMECGLCSYYCIARRPMMQYMLEAKKVIAAEENLAQLPMQM